MYFLLMLLEIIFIKSQVPFFRCGVDDEHIPVIRAKNYVEIDQNHPAYKRKLDGDEYKDFHIYLDLANIESEITKFGLEKYKTMYIESLKKAVKTLESLLKVKKPTKGFKFTDNNIKNINISYWNKTVVGSEAKDDLAAQDIDMILFGRFDENMDKSTLASAGPRYTDPDTNRPVIGVVNINTKVDYSKINSDHYFQTIILHEFTHALGFLYDYFKDTYKNIFTKKDADGIVRTYINSPKVLEVAKKYFNCPTIEGVELEESGGEGTAGSHWEARILLGDYMNGVSYKEEEVISEFTLALLEDSGYYKPNYYTGGLMRYGKGKGCDFVNNKCINSKREVNPLFQNEYFNSTHSTRGIDASCSSGRQSRTYHFISIYSEMLPEHYRYFEQPQEGGWSPADYCPVSVGISNEETNAYYVGHCSSLGKGDYGTRIYYWGQGRNETHYWDFTYFNKSGDLMDITGETFSSNSFCYQSTLIKNGITFNATSARAICYESYCSERSLTIKIKDDYFVCPRTGGKIKVEGYTGYFLCADYNLICSGTVMCNDLFDCVEKKSETKEDSYKYDYNILTSQNLEDAEINDPDNTNNYELSEDGICPKDCKQCQANKKCIKCRDGYNFVGSRENQEIKCELQSILNTGYYKENDIYYKCMNNCDSCKNGESCDKCTTDFEYSNGQCIKQIANCQAYGTEGNCDKCGTNFAFKEDDKTICLSITTFENYYTKDDGISYTPCDKDIENCAKCYYDKSQSKAKCYLCNNDFVFFGEDNKCLSGINLEKIYYNINVTHINKCSNVINNCIECENEKTCSKCEDDFNIINGDSSNCVHKSSIIVNSNIATNSLTQTPTNSPTQTPTNSPTQIPTNSPTQTPTNSPTQIPTNSHIITSSTNNIINPSTNKNIESTTNTQISTNNIITYSTNIPISTNKITDMPSNQSITTENILNPPTDYKEEEELSEKEAEILANISLSFKEINNFIVLKNKKQINFDIYVLTTEGQINEGDEIYVYVNLIYANGTRDIEISESKCISNKPKESKGSVEVKLSCNIENIQEGNIYSLRYNTSEKIAGIPNDEIALDPVLTQKYKKSNNTKIIPTFTYESLDHSDCKNTGKLKIKGSMSEKLNEQNKFKLDLTYPEGISLLCELNQEQNEMECKVDREINDKTIIIEQTVVKQGVEDYFNLKSVNPKEKVNCLNAVLQDSIKKENIPVSFRQVSHFAKNNTGFSFILIALISEKMNKGKKLTIKVNINNEKEDKEINCILEDSVTPQNGQSQGSFLCSIDKNKNSDWKNVNLNNLSVKISPNNELISGVSDLNDTKSNPAKTDEEIKNIKEKLQKNETVNVLTNVIDYYNDKIEVNTLTLDSIDIDTCKSTGKLILNGALSNDIEEKINFDLPLTYPNVELKCELNEVKKNTKTEIKCKSQSEFKSVESIVIEPQLIKKLNQELFYIKGKTFNLESKKSCEKYETIKRQIIHQRQSSGVFYAFMGKLSIVDQFLQFFMALTKNINAKFNSSYTFFSDLKVSNTRNLRYLEETLTNIKITCNEEKGLSLDKTGGFNCKSDSDNIKGNPLSLEIDTDKVTEISGIEKANSQIEFNDDLDYSKLDNLKKINELPEINIENIYENTCSQNGQYKLEGSITDISKLESKYSNIEITFSNPESTGLCEIDINKSNKKINMNCENREKFGISQIIIDRSLIQDSKGNNIFFINSFSTAEQFSCGISPNSLKSDIPEESSPTSIPTTIGIVNPRIYKPKKSSTGLSGGAIAGIVIACVAVVAVVAILILLLKKRSPNNIKVEANSTINEAKSETILNNA